MASRRPALKPRKTPVQSRSTHTVEAIRTACIQVLLDVGIERLTTTRVAERAGVSVGSLYQYFPNKQSLLASVLEQHLLAVVEAVEAACQRARGQPLAAMANAIVRAFFDAKFAEPATSRALYGVAAELGGEAVVARMVQRSQRALAEMLATATDRRPVELKQVSFVLSTAVVGPVQALLAACAPAAAVAQVQLHVVAMLASYLAAVAAEPAMPRPAGRAPQRRAKGTKRAAT